MMMIERCIQAGRRGVAAILAIQAVLFWPSLVSAQSGSLLNQGTSAAMYGRCQTDVLSNDLLRAAAALGAFAPDTVTRITAGGDEMSVIAGMCAQQIHQHRCTAKIVAVAGDLLMKGNPGGKAVASPTVNSGTIVGGTAGLLTGVLLGSREGTGTALGAGLIGGALGAAGGTAYWNKQLMNECIHRQQQLDSMSANLTGNVSSLSLAALQQLLVDNVQRRRISESDADALITEANKLSQRAAQVFQAMR
jgi:hypothetical protein